MRYDNYTDTGEFWIKSIPASWKIRRLKSCFTFGKGLPITKADLMEEGIPVISYGQVHAKYNTGTGLSDSLYRFVPNAFLESHPQCLVHKNDFIFADTSEDRNGCGNCAFVDKETLLFAGYHSIILRNRDSEDNKYLAYLFLTDAWRSQIRAKVDGVKLFSISKTILGSTNVILPSREEQDQIVRYLDWKVSRINHLIHGYQREIALLKERRMTLINDAVTKGIHRDVPMQHTDSNWMGDIPAHWKTLPAKRIFERQRREPLPNDDVVTCFRDGQVTLRKNRRTTGFTESIQETGYQHICKGDLVIHAMDAFAGAIGVSDSDGKGTPVYSVCTPKIDGIENYYFMYVLRKMAFTGYIQSLYRGIRERSSSFTFDIFSKQYLPIPTIEEQQEIVNYIELHSSRLSIAADAIQKEIDLLREYRTRLISDVVTGQVDVRGEAIPDYTPEEDTVTAADGDDSEDEMDDESEAEKSAD